MRIAITDLRALDGDTLVAVHLHMRADSGEEERRIYHILPEQYAALRLRIGEIDCAAVDAIEEASQLAEVIRKGIALLSYGAQSEKTLCRKLRARGYAPELASAAAAHLRGLGLMDEGEDAVRIVTACRRKLWGMRRILSHLYEKGYPEAVIRRVQDELEEEDFVPDCAALIRKKVYTLPKTREERQRLTAALVRYGYTIGEIRAAMASVAAEDREGEE